MLPGGKIYAGKAIYGAWKVLCFTGSSLNLKKYTLKKASMYNVSTI